MRNILILVLIVLGNSLPAEAANQPIKFELSVSPELSVYADTLLVSPAYAAIALQNAGLPVSLSQPLKIISRQSFQIGPGKVGFQKKSANIYYYSVSLALPLGKELSIPVEIDVIELKKGHISIVAYPPFSGLIPEDVLIRVESKLQILTNINAQRQLSVYLAAKSGGKNNPEAMLKLMDAIVFDAINNSSQIPGLQNSRQEGVAEPLKDQLLLIVSVLIWLLGFPLFLYTLRRQRENFLANKNGE